jgi:ElaB/YqjD/DUF883 family membrane-anchored ribosome-binding protein
MGKDPGAGRAGVTDPQDPEQIQRDIEETRGELGDTVEALAEKADLKAQAREKIEATKASVAEKKEELLAKAKQASPDGAASVSTQASKKARENPLPLVAAGAFALGFLAGRRGDRG